MQRRLARARRAHDRGEAAGGEVDGHVVEGADGGVARAVDLGGVDGAGGGRRGGASGACHRVASCRSRGGAVVRHGGRAQSSPRWTVLPATPSARTSPLAYRAVVRRGQPAPAGADQAGLVGEDDELGPVAGAELDHRPAHVGLGGGRADERAARRSRRCDSPSATSAITSRSRSVSASSVGGARPGSLARAGELGDEPAGHAGRQQRLAGGDGPHRPQQLGRLGVLDAGSRWRPTRSASNTYSSSSNVVRMTTAHRRQALVGGDRAGSPRGRRAPGMRMSMSTTSGAWLARQRDGLVAVGGLADDLDVVLGVEQGAEAGPHQRLVVGEQRRGSPRLQVRREAAPGPGSRRRARGPASSVPPTRLRPAAHAGDAAGRRRARRWRRAAPVVVDLDDRRRARSVLDRDRRRVRVPRGGRRWSAPPARSGTRPGRRRRQRARIAVDCRRRPRARAATPCSSSGSRRRERRASGARGASPSSSAAQRLERRPQLAERLACSPP